MKRIKLILAASLSFPPFVMADQQLDLWGMQSRYSVPSTTENATREGVNYQQFDTDRGMRITLDAITTHENGSGVVAGASGRGQYFQAGLGGAQELWGGYLFSGIKVGYDNATRTSAGISTNSSGLGLGYEVRYRWIPSAEAFISKEAWTFSSAGVRAGAPYEGGMSFALNIPGGQTAITIAGLVADSSLGISNGLRVGADGRVGRVSFRGGYVAGFKFQDAYGSYVEPFALAAIPVDPAHPWTGYQGGVYGGASYDLSKTSALSATAFGGDGSGRGAAVGYSYKF